MPDDTYFLSEGGNESLTRQLQWHTIVVITSPSFLYIAMHRYIPHLIVLLLLRNQAAQLTCIIDGRLKDATEDIDREKALKAVIESMA